MPSYRYTRDIKAEDLQPEQGPELTKKQKRQNWWHYHWKLVAAIGLAAVMLGFFVAEVVRQPDPDMEVALLTGKTLPDAVTELLAEQLGTLVGDLNGDGKVLVEILVCNVNPYSEEEEPVEGAGAEIAAGYEDPYAQMAGVTRLTAALQDESTMLYIMETELLAQYQEAYGILGYLDGASPAADATDYENMAFAWGDSPTLAALDFTIEYEGGTFDAHEYMNFFSLGVRRLEDTKLAGNEKAEENRAQALELVDAWR